MNPPSTSQAGGGRSAGAATSNSTTRVTSMSPITKSGATTAIMARGGADGQAHAR